MRSFVPQSLQGLSTSLPIYVTRPQAGNGATATYSQSAWMTLAVVFVVSCNIMLWGGIGIYEAIRFIV